MSILRHYFNTMDCFDQQVHNQILLWNFDTELF